MQQEVKVTEPRSKKLFEWDSENKQLDIMVKGYKYTCVLDHDNMFKLVNIQQKTNK